jgi:uncharacterized protein YbjT (DUF2867 family)
MKILITGGSGFVGNAAITALLARGHSIHALVNREPIDLEGAQSFSGGLSDTAALDAAMDGCDTVIHLVGIIKEKPAAGITFNRMHVQGTVQVVEAARRAGIPRYLHMSALGASPTAAARYLQSKFRAEQVVRNSKLDWTIFQPSLIHGPGGDFSRMEESWARGKAVPFFFMPYFGNGLLGRANPAKVQPVFVEDVARAFVESLENPKTIGEVFPIGGPEQMTWPQMHRIASRVIVGHPRLTLAIPAWYAKAITFLVPAAMLPFTHDQVLMAQQDNVCDLSKFKNAFGWAPQPFEQSLEKYAPHRATRVSG